MKSNAPWSVKGIERDARETAKEAARREGMTVGEWLNQVIYTAGDPASSNGEIEGLKTSDLVSAIEHLNKKVINAEAKGAAALDDLARNFAGVVERVQRLERVRPGASTSVDIEERLQRIEAKTNDRQRIEALKALEKAVSQVALQYDAAHKSSISRIESTEKQLQQLASRFDSGGGAAEGAPSAIAHLQDTIEGLSARIARAEKIASEAAQLKAESAESMDAEFVERTGTRLRVLGDEIKRGGDQIRALEGSIKKLSDQIDAAERRSSEGVQKVAETISELRTQFSLGDGASVSGGAREEIEAAVAEATQRTETKIAQLKNSFDTMVSRYKSAETVEEDPALEIEDAVELEIDGIEEEDRDDAAAQNNTAGETEAETDDLSDAAFSSFDLDEELEAQKEAEETAAGEAEPDAEDDNAFEFDLDDDEKTPASRSLAASMLSEVEDAFAGKTTKPPEPEIDSSEDGLDAILSELETSTPDETAADTEALGDLDEPDAPESPASTASSDFLKTARLAAKENAERVESEAAMTRRKLTPKQRAILAAKIRRKRLAEKGLSLDIDTYSSAPADPASESAAQSESCDEEKKPSLAAKAGGVLGAIRSRLHGGKSEEAAETAPAPNEDDWRRSEAPSAGNPNILVSARTAIGRVKAKPLTIALGASILLAGAALFFLVKDMFVSDPSKPVQQERTAQTAPGAADDAPTSETPAAPEQPMTQPRQLYLESVAKLKSASGDNETREAIRGLEQAAALGHPPAQLQLGELYKLGQGVPQDPAQARAWYERAAEGGNVLAMHRSGVMAARGQGGPADQEEAIQWFTRAANLGLVDSQYNLGALYHPGGDGSNAAIQDAGEAYYWYSLAQKNGDEQAGALASALAAGIPADRRKSIDARAAEWTAETPNPDANEIAPAS